MGALKARGMPAAAAPVHQSPLWAKPKKAGLQQRRPAALHLGLSATVTMALLATGYCLAYELMPRGDTMRGLLLMGFNIAMITATLLAMPVLGSSVQKAAARIAGVVVGCWLFYGFYLATDAWWALALLLGAFGFALVAGSSVAGWIRSAGPPALMSAFVVIINFNSSRAALPATITKTIAIAGCIALHTLVAMSLAPHTATAEYMTQMALALRELQAALAAVAVGDHASALEAGTSGATGHHGHHHRHGTRAAHSSDSQAADVAGVVELGSRAGAAAGGDDVGDVEAPAGADQTHKQQEQQAGRKVDKDTPHKQQGVQQEGAAAGGSVAVAASDSPAGPCLSTCRALLAGAEAALPAAQNEKYVGECGGSRCYVAAPVGRREHFPELAGMRLLEAARQTLRVLVLLADRSGAAPLAVSSLPPGLAGHHAPALRAALAHTLAGALATLQAITTALPPGNKVGPVRGVPREGLAAMEEGLVELVGATLLATQGPGAGATGRMEAAAAGAGALPMGGSDQAVELHTAASRGPQDGSEKQEGVSWGVASKWRSAAAAVQKQRQQQQQQQAGEECGGAQAVAAGAAGGSKPAGAASAGSQGAKPNVSAAFITTLRTAASSGPKAQLADWYGLLLLLRQLLRSLRALADSTEGLLTALPPVIDVAAAAE